MKIYTTKEIKESRLLLDRKPPAFGVIMTIITLILLIGILLLAGLTTRTYVVKASGLSVSANRTNIMNKVAGSVEELYVEEGQLVKKGDIIISLDGTQTKLQIAQLQANVDFYNQKAEVVERLIVFVNKFTLSNAETRKNPFDKTKTEEMKAYVDAQTFIDYIAGQEKAAAEEETPKEYTQAEADGLKTQYLSQQYSALDEYLAQSLQYRSQAEMYIKSLDEYVIKSGQDGVVHLTSGITVGTMLQAGSLLGSVSDGKQNTLLFESLISVADRSKVSVGNEVEIALTGVMQSEFGVLKGKVEAIDTDSTQTEKGEVFYKVVIKPTSTALKDKKGNEVQLTLGMMAESRIKYDETTWLKWAIEQIGVKFR